MEFREDLVRGSIIPIVLQLLKEKAMYGYEIVKVVNERTDGKLEWKEGTLYPALHRLESRGFVSSKWEEAPSGKKRKYYMLTRKGMAELATRTVEWKEFSYAVNSVLAVAHVAV